jgi:diguanylate cyclase (GGDEF)-like protein
VCSDAHPAGDRRYPLAVGDTAFGVLLVGPATVELGPAERFFADVARQIARGFDAATRAEHLRREAAVATASRLASQLSDERLADGLEELALALASLPSVIAAELVVDHVAVGPPLRLRSGFWDGDGHAHSVENVTLDAGASGRLTARIRSADESIPDENAVHGVIECLARSLDAIVTTRALREEAETEPLTGLGNRRRLARSLEQQLSRAQRYGERVALLLLDLDRFKAVNDELGHDVGDAVIVACAQALRERTRAYDELVRLGGDEFVVVAAVPDVLDARHLADEIRARIALRCNALLPAGWGLTAAVGVAVFPDAALDPESLLRAADVALYRAKDRDGVMLADPVEPDLMRTERRPAQDHRRLRRARRAR